MSYSARVTRAAPTCFLFLVDQSSSMNERIQGRTDMPRKSEIVADAINRTLTNLILKATKEEDLPRRYYQVGVIGYGQAVGSILGDALGWQDLVWIDELYLNPLRIEERTKKESDGVGGVVESKVRFPVWFDPVANGQTPMCQALNLAHRILSEWVQQNPDSYPPVVMNLTDGEANDGDPRTPAMTLCALATDDGNVLLYTLHVSSSEFAGTIDFPDNIADLPNNPARIMFEASSVLPETDFLFDAFREIVGRDKTAATRGLIYQGSLEYVVRFLDIGTSTRLGGGADRMSLA